MTNNNVIPFSPRLPMPTGIEGMDIGKWRVLTDAIFPSARTTEAVVMALDYCRVRNLDVFKRMVHIVPMWSTVLQAEIETVWPGINELLVTASRTGAFAGMDEPVIGPMVSETFTGQVKEWNNSKNRYVTEDMSIDVTYPEWAVFTVYRMVNGVRCPFPVKLYWKETYARYGLGGQWSKLPTTRWALAPIRQFLKCCKAAALRDAFPEECADYVAEEMEGREVDTMPRYGVVVPTVNTEETTPSVASNPTTASDETKAWVTKLIDAARGHGGTWAAAIQSAKSRLTDGDLAYALDAIEAAKQEAVSTQPAPETATAPSEPTVSDELKARTSDLIKRAITSGKWEAAIAAVRKQLESDPVSRDWVLEQIQKARQEKTAA